MEASPTSHCYMSTDSDTPLPGGLHGPVFDHLLAGGTVVTSNQRLSRLLRQGFDTHQGGALDAWRSADVLPVTAWLARCHEEVTVRGWIAPAAVLSAPQEQVVWEQVIEDDLRRNAPDSLALMHRVGSARMAVRAYTLALQWNLPPSSLASDPSPDVRAFARWREAFEGMCRARGWVARAALPARVLQALSSEPLAQTRASWLRAPIMATGFDAMAPDLRAVFEHPAVSATFQDEPGTPGSPRVFAAADPTDEAERAADWACQCLARGQGRIGIVTLDPGADTRLLERALERRVHPGRAPDADGANRLFDVSRGEALADEPVVAQALRTLDLAIRGLGAEELGRWLLSPFGKGAVDELDARALLDLKLRGAGIGGWDALAKQSPDLRGQGGISALAAGLGRMRKELRDAPRSAVLSAWAGRFGRVLRAAGWPGGRTPNSREFQAIAHWSDLLDTLVSLEHQLGPVSADAALEYLNALAREQVFQQRVDAAPIQVLGVLEAAGMSFDALWILGVTEDVWPPMPNPDPLLPREEQRRRAMPHASAERELEFARGITARLLAGAPEVVVSYPRSANDAPVRPSALIAAFARLDADEIVPAGLWMDVFSPEELEATDDPRGPELDADANTGGVALLQDQSACAFRAFAHHRLKLRPIEEVAEGPDARERGTLVHLALQRFWEGLEGRSPRLLALDEEGLKTRAGEAAMQALEERRGKAPQFYSGPISGLEGARLTELVERWAQTEQQRSVGFRVESMEAEQQLDFGPLSLRGRVDRVDLLDNGERLIIDYKTGRIPGTGKAWRDPPPAEPQLPAYGLCLDAGGIAYAQVRAEQCRWTGLASADVGIKGVKSVSADETGPGWDGLMEEWRGALDGLASEFASGWAAVMPRDEAVCSYCALGGVCRVE